MNVFAKSSDEEIVCSNKLRLTILIKIYFELLQIKIVFVLNGIQGLHAWLLPAETHFL